MSTYEKTELASDKQSYFRWLGGRRVRFGRDKLAAKLNSAKTQIFWQRISENLGEWDDQSWDICKAIARGQAEYRLAPPIKDDAEGYSIYVEGTKGHCTGLIQVVAARPDLYNLGIAEMTNAKDNLLRADDDRRRQLKEELDLVYPLAHDRGLWPEETLHKALDAYIAKLESTKGEDFTGWGAEKIKQATALKKLPNLVLANLNLDEMERQLAYFGNRPVSLKGKRISPLTARNRMKQLKDFWRWLDRSDVFHWEGPRGWHEIRSKIADLPGDNDRLLQAIQVDTFSIEDLVLMYRVASPLVRLFMLLGLNFGFSTAEMGALKASSFEGTKLKFIRPKTKVYGEWLIWPETLEALRERQSKTKGEWLLVSSTGRPLAARTTGGNKGTRIPNIWENLMRTCVRAQPNFRCLPIKYLRKTASNMVRKVSDGEIAGMFLMHGQPVRGDMLANVYSNKPWDKLDAATEQVRTMLAPMFQG